jgi:lysophospholipase L1-like esterase
MSGHVVLLVRRVVLAVAVAVGVTAVPGGAAAASLPSSIASLGDSITRGFNACGWYVDCTSRSWSTGDNSGVKSHYLRLLALNRAISGRNYNDARSGAKASALAGQVGTAIGRGAQYVTIEIGANDACTSSESTMTAVATYGAQIDAALTKLKAGLPNARVFIASIPDIKRLWYIGKGSWAARYAWSEFGICQSMLANPTSTAAADVARRDRVRQRVIDYNTRLARACTAYGTNCDFDGNAVFNYRFVLSQVSGWDYFHPNAEGQRVLAQVTWNAGFAW